MKIYLVLRKTFKLKTYFIVGAIAMLSTEPREAASQVFPDAAAMILWRWRRSECRLAQKPLFYCRQSAATFSDHQASMTASLHLKIVIKPSGNRCNT